VKIRWQTNIPVRRRESGAKKIRRLMKMAKKNEVIFSK
jgi:hypothetical protein